MKKVSSKWSLVALVIGTMVAAGCSAGSGSDDSRMGGDENTQTEDSTLALVTGHVTNEGNGNTDWGLAGARTVDLTRTVRISSIDAATGALTSLVESAMKGDGSFSMKVPFNSNWLVVEALDASGKVIGSSMLEGTLKAAGKIFFAAPISTQSSVHAKALIDIAATLKGSADLSVHAAAYVKAMLDADISAAVAVAVAAGADLHAVIHAVAKSAFVAHRTELISLRQNGINVDMNALQSLAQTATQAVNRTMDARGCGCGGGGGGGGGGSIGIGGTINAVINLSATLVASLDAALDASADLSAELRARVHAAANLAFRATLDASLKAALSGAVDVKGALFTTVKAAAALEASLSAKLLSDIVHSCGCGSPGDVHFDATLNLALKASAKLVASISAAASLDAIVKAHLDFATAITGSLTGSLSADVKGVIALVVNAVGGINAALSAVVDASVAANAKLDVDLKAALSAVAKLNIDGSAKAAADLDAALGLVVKAYANASANLKASGIAKLTAAGATNAQANAVVDLISVATTSLKDVASFSVK